MIWTLLYIAVGLYILLRIGTMFWNFVNNSTYPYRKHWALAVAAPMTDAQGLEGFSSPDSVDLADTCQQTLRAGLLHYLELSPASSNEDAIRHLSRNFEASWYRADLHSLNADDDPRAAIAFACVRLAFFSRVLMLMKWIEPDLAWRVLLLNAQRARECFNSWEDFGQAYLAGRRQWLARFRADPLSCDLEEASVRAFTHRTGAWSFLPWSGEAPFDPQPGKTA
ncbi:DUF1266 domain-containing protein [Niveibacterium terrae]|uniref:DUF1266 domain-containing protein n=1 Tax=Niveibacterium terrae TaxID=3373598 RepID=UPI003A8D6B7A